MNVNKLDSIVDEFELAFNNSKEPILKDFLPSESDDQYQEIATELIRVEMELRWNSNSRKTLDDYSSEFPEILQNPDCRELIAFEEYRCRIMSGEDVSPKEYHIKYEIDAGHWPVFEPLGLMVRDDDLDIETNKNQLTVHKRATNLAQRISSGQLESTKLTLESLLRRRLKLISIWILLSLLYLTGLSVSNPDSKVGLFLGSYWLVVIHFVCILLCLSILIFLWSRIDIGLAYLRYLELLLFGSILGELAVGLSHDLFVDNELAVPLEHGAHEVFHYASSWCLPFFALAVAYGTMIPSGWKRCIWVVSTIACTPLLIGIFASIFIYGVTTLFIESFLLQMIIWMLIAVSIAVYGVRRIEDQYQLFKFGRLGSYRLIRKIASGGMGDVFEGEHRVLKKRCAIKIIHPSHVSDASALRRFEREVQVLAGLSHSGIVQIYDFGSTSDDIFFYVMELLEGNDLEQAILSQGKMSTADAKSMILDVAMALETIHAGGVFHRDVKPSNIYLHQDGSSQVVKLLDFGLIKPIDKTDADQRLTQFGILVGTPAYMSPEQAAGNEADERSDIYCLALVAYYALSGKHLFAKDTAAETMAAQINSRPPDAKNFGIEISEGFEAILLKCLSKDPTSRFQSVSELIQSLKELDE